MKNLDLAKNTKQKIGNKIFPFLIAILGMFVAPYAIADSLWNHNGSVMRLRAVDNNRTFEYEIPSAKMKAAGVKKGTLLFQGVRQGNRYIGTAKVFSKYCATPLKYEVQGYVTETYVALAGQREVYGAGCVPTGKMKQDTLEFRYISEADDNISGE